MTFKDGRTGKNCPCGNLDFGSSTFDSSIVFVRFGRIFTAFALMATLGGHWAFLQTLAWTTMLADNLQSCSFHDAVVKTFDGRHPCPLCKAIAAGKKSEKENEFTLQIQKFEFPQAKENLVLIAPPQFQLLPAANHMCAESLTHKPPTPPPRGFFV